MKCGNCGNFVYWEATGSMGGSHSNFYKCYHCGAVYLIEDRYKSDVTRSCDLINFDSLSETKTGETDG